jgi:hypothetical protein
MNVADDRAWCEFLDVLTGRTPQPLSDDEIAQDDPDLCEHGWSRLHLQPCPECKDAENFRDGTIGGGMRRYRRERP